MKIYFATPPRLAALEVMSALDAHPLLSFHDIMRRRDPSATLRAIATKGYVWDRHKVDSRLHLERAKRAAKRPKRASLFEEVR